MSISLDPDHHFTAHISQDAQDAPNCEPCINLFSKVEGTLYGIIIHLHMLRMEQMTKMMSLSYSKDKNIFMN